MKRLALLLSLILLLSACTQDAGNNLAQTVQQALQAQNIAYEPIDLWQTEALPAYEYRGGTLHRSEAQHYSIFSGSNCLGVLRIKGQKTDFLPVHHNAALLLASCYIQGNEALLCCHAEGCDLLLGESILRMFDAPNETLDVVTDKEALRDLAAQLPKSPVRFAQHLRTEPLPEVSTLPAETPEDIPKLVRTAAAYRTYTMLWQRNAMYPGEPIPESTAEFFFANAIPEYQYADGALTPQQDNGRDYHPIFADGRFVGQAYWNKDASPEEMYLQFGPDMPLQKQLYTKLERFYKTGDSLAIVSVNNGGGYFLVVNGTVVPLYDTAQTALAQLRLDEVQAAVDAQGLTHAKARSVFSFHMTTYEQYYDEPWPAELNCYVEEYLPLEELEAEVRKEAEHALSAPYEDLWIGEALPCYRLRDGVAEAAPVSVFPVFLANCYIGRAIVRGGTVRSVYLLPPERRVSMEALEPSEALYLMTSYGGVWLLSGETAVSSAAFEWVGLDRVEDAETALAAVQGLPAGKIAEHSRVVE